MLSYRHAFHAGNHADILKHISLVCVLDSMIKKDKNFTAIDTHAGAGIYTLDDERALKTGETENGIIQLSKKLLDFPESEIPEAIKNYISVVNPYLQKNQYPGSPEIIRKFLRQGDIEFLFELHNSEIEILKSNIHDSKVKILHQNSFENIKSLVPPTIKRGLLLMDPSYEVVSDYENSADSLILCHKKWNVGVLCLWYPLLKHRKSECEMMIDKIVCGVERIAKDKPIQIDNFQFIVDSPEKEMGLYGSGMLIINTPWQVKEKIQEAISFLNKTL